MEVDGNKVTHEEAEPPKPPVVRIKFNSLFIYLFIYFSI